MFHRSKNDTVQPENNNSNEPQKTIPPQTDNAKVVSQSSLNNETKGTNKMNTTPTNTPNGTQDQAEQNKTSDQAQGANGQQRVDIPGNNFQRPNAQQPASRPAYPGSYPGATNNSPSYSAASANSDDSRRLTIGKGITLAGEIESCEHLVVAGTVEASLKGAKVLEISESGSFYGTVEIEEANIAGNFEGDITVSGRLSVQSTGVISGSISYKELAMEVGATLDGSVSPLGAEGKKAKKPAPSKSKKASVDSSAELPFSGGKATAA